MKFHRGHMSSLATDIELALMVYLFGMKQFVSPLSSCMLFFFLQAFNLFIAKSLQADIK